MLFAKRTVGWPSRYGLHHVSTSVSTRTERPVLQGVLATRAVLTVQSWLRREVRFRERVVGVTTVYVHVTAERRGTSPGRPLIPGSMISVTLIQYFLLLFQVPNDQGQRDAARLLGCLLCMRTVSPYYLSYSDCHFHAHEEFRRQTSSEHLPACQRGHSIFWHPAYGH